MKNLLLLLVVLFSFTGCSYLKGLVAGEDAEELAYLEDEESGEEEMDEDADEEEEEWGEEEEEEMNEDADEEDGEEEWDEEEEGEEWDEEEEGEEWDEEEEGEEWDEEEEEEEEEEEAEEGKQKKKGFFARIFKWGDDDSEEEEEWDDEEAAEVGEEDGESDIESGGMDEEGEMEYDDSESDFGGETDFGGGEAEAAGEDMPPSQPTDPVKAPPAEAAKKEKPRIIPLKKIKRTAYRKGAYLVNAVYIARRGDTIESVSQKIYNSDQKAALYTINPHLRSRSVKVGDKIYYRSPRRPQDDSGVFIYYEDLGVSPRTHVISPGENIRAVSKDLLGHENSWKEIWATNPDIASKGVVSEAIELKYWLDVSPAAPPGDFSDVNEDREGQPTDRTEEEGVEEDVMLEEEQAEEEDSDEVLDPGPADTNRKKKAAEWVIIVGVFLLILLSLATFVIKRRREKQEFNYTSTNVQSL